MAKQAAPDINRQIATLKADISKGIFSPVYLLFGEEPYYLDIALQLIMDNALQEQERDFNQTLLYGADANVDELMSMCSRFPMMAERQLIVVKEAQQLKKIDHLSLYLDHIVDTTVLVLCMSGKGPDKRTAFYKKLIRSAVTIESGKVREEAIPAWIEKYTASLGKDIEAEAALLLSEFAGNELRKIALEIDKLIKAIPPEASVIKAADVERNVGLSREFNATELANALAARDAAKAYRIGYYMGESPSQYPIQLTLGFLFYFFAKVEKIQSYRLGSPLSPGEAAAKAGIYSRYAGSYLDAVQNYSLKKTMRVISYLKECDLKSKGELGGEASPKDLLIELISKILS